MMKNEERQAYRAAVFFDGTGNNKVNARRDPDKFGVITNITRLFEACVVSDKLYVEGVGTLDNEDDSQWAKATGNNPIGYSGYGYDDKLSKGLDFLATFRQTVPNEEVHLLVYGFSRGAALARDFAKRVLAYSNVRIQFLGIYDTVVSLLRLTTPAIHFTNQDMERIDEILHLTAINEARNYFPLTSIQQRNGAQGLLAIENYYTPKVKEVFVPGAHADVGGGYAEGAENVLLRKGAASSDTLGDELTIIRSTVVDFFSCSSSQAIWSNLLNESVVLEPVSGGYNLESKRNNVKVDLPVVYFEVMAAYSNFSLQQDAFEVTSTVTIADLQVLKDNLDAYLQTNVPLKGACFAYANYAAFTHISSNYGVLNQIDIQFNQEVNTFNPALLFQEMETIRAACPSADLEQFNEGMVYQSFSLAPWDINAPNNKEWHRKVIYG